MANEINDGGPAHPVFETDRHRCIHEGASLRDYFAAHALAGLLAHGWWKDDTGGRHARGDRDREGGSLQTSERAFAIADAMLAVRERKADS